MDALLEVKNIWKSFGALVALKGVSLRVPKGKITLLIGPNGSGKSTLLNIISGLLEPDEGKVIFEGVDITKLPSHERHRLGLVRGFQIPRLMRNLLVDENVALGRADNPGESLTRAVIEAFWLEFESKTISEVNKTLDSLALSQAKGKKPGELSGGQMKLLDLARVMMAKNVKLVLLDEPTAGVNPVLAHEIFKVLKKLATEGGLTFLVVEHRLDIAVDYADYAYALHLGEVIAEGDPHEVLKNPKVIASYLGE
ncbi:MAG: ABC transporter ATP-binding protein [Acidilobaceae archaeon]